MSTATGAPDKIDEIGVVVIGRNEGIRLEVCLKSVIAKVATVVYVDSGSTDDSLTVARALGVEVVELDMSTPFSAARARNAGFNHAHKVNAQLRAIQFVDGDCEVRPHWIKLAWDFLKTHDRAAAVGGRRRERYPEASIYNEICDLEWATPAGEVNSCGGDVMIKVDALSQSGGYLDHLIAGEEPELCVRLRSQGWTIHVLEAEMTLHDAALLTFRQWWLRMQRGGWAYAAGNHLHGGAPERHWIKESIKIWVWGALPTALVLLLLPFFGSASLLILLVYPAQFVRIYLLTSGSHRRRRAAAFAYTVGRFPELKGQIKYWMDATAGRTTALLEYK